MSEEIRAQIMALIEAEIALWDDDQPPRHALSAVWGKVRDLPLDRPNVPPADDLAAVRDQIKALREREDSLRALLLSDPSARTGNKFVAEVLTITQDKTDWKELRKMHPALVEEFTFPLQFDQVQLKIITEDGEIVARPKRRA
jgi:hypothetical protein